MAHTKHTLITGFTLVELMIAIVMAALLITLAVPTFDEIIQRNRATTLANDFLAGLELARTEAIKRGTTVSLCAASDASQSSCGGNTDWVNGWVMFVDSDADGQVDSGTDIIKTQYSLPAGTAVETTISNISFSSQGFVASGDGNFSLTAPGCTGNNMKVVTLSKTGRAHTAQAACGE